MRQWRNIGDTRECDSDEGMRIVIAGGGTGGHLFPGIAIADAFKVRFAGSRIIFVTSGRAIEKRVLSQSSYDTCQISAAGFKGAGVIGKLKALVKVPAGLVSALFLFYRFRPHAVIGMGAYSAAPVVVAAWMLRIFRVIHEQNRIAGMTNRFLARFANRIYVSFPDTDVGEMREKVKFTGNPIRRAILKDPASAGTASGNEAFTVLILGGSQGAHAVNTAMMAALAHLQDLDRLRFIHQTGALDRETVRSAYTEAGVTARVEAFFDDMAACYGQAALIICRAGATSVAEVAAAALPAIFIPYPYAADNHQYFNAKSLVDAGAAEMIPQAEASGRVLADRIRFYAENEAVRRQMRENVRMFSRPEAADTIVDDICANAPKGLRGGPLSGAGKGRNMNETGIEPTRES